MISLLGLPSFLVKDKGLTQVEPDTITVLGFLINDNFKEFYEERIKILKLY
jgi:peptidyl-tRNA hydrolase